MPDIFDEIAPDQQGDIFDQVAAEGPAAVGVGQMIQRAKGRAEQAMVNMGADTLQGLARTAASATDDLRRLEGVVADVTGTEAPRRTALGPGGATIVDPIANAMRAYGDWRGAQGAAPEGGVGRFMVETLPSAAGSMAGFVGTGILGRVAGLSRVASVAGPGAAAGGESAFREAKAAGADDETAWKAFLVNAGAGLTEAVPISKWLSRADAGGTMRRAMIEGVEEGAQEIFQQLAGNAAARELYDPERPWVQGAGESGAAGATLGVVGSVLASALTRRRGALAIPAPDQTPEQPAPELDEFGGMQGLEGGESNGSQEAQIQEQPAASGLTPAEVPGADSADGPAALPPVLDTVQEPAPSPEDETKVYHSSLLPGLFDRERKLSERLQQADWLTPEARDEIRNRSYQIQSMKAAEAAAADLVNELGPERAEQIALDRTVDMPMGVRGALTSVVSKEYARRERAATTPEEAREWRSRNSDYLSRLLPQTTEYGQYINMLKAFSDQTPQGAVLTAQRILRDATEQHVAQYKTLIEAARGALTTAHNVAVTDTMAAPEVQQAGREAVDEAVVKDDEIRRLIRGRAAQEIEADVRQTVTGSQQYQDAVTAAVNEHWGPNPKAEPLVAKLERAGVPKPEAEKLAKRWNDAFVQRVGQIEWGIRKSLISERDRAKQERALNSVWALERKDAAAALVKAMAPAAGSAPKPALQEFARRVAARLRQQLAPTKPGQPALSDLQVLREAADNVDRFGEVWDEALRQAKADGKTAIVDALQSKAPQVFGDPRLDRVIGTKLKEWNLKMGEAVRRSRSAQTGKIGDTIAKEAGLSEGSAAFRRLADAVNARFERTAKARKEREIAKLLEGQGKSGTPAKLAKAFKDVVALNDLSALNRTEFWDKIRERLGLRGLDQDAAERLMKLADDIAAIPEDQQFRRQEATLKLMDQLHRMRSPLEWWELPMGVYFAHILSGWKTHAVNIISNAANLTGSLTVATLRNPSALPQIGAALARGLKQGGVQAVEALRTGAVTGPRIGDKFGDPGVWRKVDKKWLLPWEMVGRLLAAEDLVFFNVAAEARQAQFAKALARKEGLKGQALRNRTLELLAVSPADRSAAAVQATREGFTGLRHARRVTEILQAKRDAFANFTETGREFALQVTFNNEPYGVLGLVAKFLNGFNARYPWGKLIVPFTNIVANVVNESLNYTPVGSARAIRGAKKGNLYGRNLDAMDWGDREMIGDLHAKAAVGTILLVGLVAKAAQYLDDDDPEFAITGQGPADKGKRDTLREAGWMPNAIKVGDRYVSYLQTPAAVPLAVAGNVMDAFRYGKLSEGDALTRSAYVLASVGKTMVQQSFLDSLARLTGSIERPSETKAGENLLDWAGRTGSSFVVPNFIRQIEQVFDPKVYDEPGAAGALMSQIPMARQQLRPAINGLGEPTTKPWQERWTKTATADPVWRELARLEVGVYPRMMTHKGNVLSDEDVYEVVRLAGPRIRARIAKAIAAPWYSRLPDQETPGKSAETKRERIQSIITEERDRAKTQVMAHR